MVGLRPEDAAILTWVGDAQNLWMRIRHAPSTIVHRHRGWACRNRGRVGPASAGGKRHRRPRI